ncbi:hypothetical protein CAPN002_21370 [Capnocytophaga stomatis]|uniref:hypothetical protein n=1 Tax=Capnocytophaga stomatis TaxID=1848904 RepID=UPI001952410C|nr:hypothetical protein [Capnocytophaga stomatis]GIJ94919.1 hypothetical protein CAPN002_21370 [Capnocytophaga stomatis]GIM49963.1 hypothetical protein CAPN003_14150 [Capnocytophaga stomatis]
MTLSLDRKYHFNALLFIKKSIFLPNTTSPKDDVVNWLFLQIEENLYGFVYKTLNENFAQYEKPFDVEISIFAFDFMKTSIGLGNVYKVFRGQEEVGWIEIRRKVE